MEFPCRLKELDIIINRNADDSRIIKALTIIHRDVLQQTKLASKAYCARHLMEALINLCRSSRNLLITILSTSLLYTMCSSNSDLIDKFFYLKGPLLLMTMISARDNSEQNEALLSQTLLLHEHAAKFLVTLSGLERKYQLQLIELGVLPKLVELCSIFENNGCHMSCCHQQIKFSSEGRSFMKELIEGRKLIGKIDPCQSAGKGHLNVLAVELFDTSTDKDININKELIEAGYAWPDIPEKNDEEDEKKKTWDMIDDPVWCDLYITKVVDAHCFWAFLNKNSMSKIEKISKFLEEYVHSLDVWNLENLTRGQKVCVPISNSDHMTKWRRGCIVDIDQSVKTCLVLLTDFGYTVKVDSSQLVEQPVFIHDIPNEACLCVLKGIKAAPEHVRILQYAAECLGNISSCSLHVRMDIHGHGGTDALLKLCKLPNVDISSKAASALANIALHHNIRWQIGCNGGCTIVIDLLRKNYRDKKRLPLLLSFLINLIIENTTNRIKIATANGLIVLMKLYQTIEHTSVSGELVLKALKNLVADGWRLLDPINVPDVRGIIEEQIEEVKGSFNLPNLCGEALLEEVKKRRRRKFRKLRDCEAEPEPTYVSLTIGDLVKRLKSTGDESSEGYDTKSEGYKTGGDSDVEDDEGELRSYEGYLFKRPIGVKEDTQNAFMYEQNIRQIRAIDIGNTVCAILNSNLAGVIYVGVNKSSQAIGINIARRERDNLRLGVDDLLDRFSPRVKHDMYEIKFVPVMIGNSIENLQQHEERSIVEIHVAQNNDKLFQTPAKKMFIRDGRKNSELTIQQIREKTIKEQEEKYQAEIRTLQFRLREARRSGGAISDDF